MTSAESKFLPLVIAGPLLRRVTPDEVTIWIATTEQVDLKIEFIPRNGNAQTYCLTPVSNELTCLTFSKYLHYQLITIPVSQSLPYDTTIDYQVSLKPNSSYQSWQNLTELQPELLFSNQTTLQFTIPSRVHSVLHGSCRKPHHPGNDGLVEAEHYLSQQLLQTADGETQKWPSMVVMSGDQIYADDVAAPMLSAIHQLANLLEFPHEEWLVDPNSDEVMTSEMLYQHPDSYYRRNKLLPSNLENNQLINVLFGGARKPIFTSVNADNHLMSLGEYLACYLLSWSSIPWQFVDLTRPEGISKDKHTLYDREKEIIEEFISGIPQAQRVFAHLPTAMILDDHDITDDFNLHRQWEETVYNHPLSKRMIGNGLLAYLINQAWGNKPEAFSAELVDEIQHNLRKPYAERYENLVSQLIRLEAWDYDWQTSPPLVVLDTRTRRWRSESSATQPSGLLDWEALTDLQSRLSGHTSVLLVSPAPIIGVKLIEVIQRVATFFGQPLAVDAEYWMAHPGTSNGILNVFKHRNTPHNFVVLSGDVHYSFVYDVELRSHNNSPHIWQICSSGLRNNFPEPLLTIFDKLNRWLYAPRSPLNWFTKRRIMKITPRKPVGSASGKRLLNHSGIGLVELNENGVPIKISQLIGAEEVIPFEKRSKEANWH